jgi:alpha-D-xyloside xylohydrolase
VPTNATADEIREEVAQFAEQDFPLDVIGLEPGWQSKSYPGTFDWNAKHFPDPAAFIAEMASQGVHVNLWENPYLAPESSMYEDMLPLTGSHMVWLGVVPDYTLEAARKILRKHHETTHLAIGVSGYKIDEVDGIDEWLWPDHAAFPSGTSGEVMRQTYGLQLQRTLFEMFRDRNERTYSLVRGSNGASSGYPFVLYSDYYDHRGFVTALVNSGFSGVLWTPEIRSANTKEEWVRRMQTVCLSHLAQLNAWSSGTKPWSMPEVNDAIRAAMHLRMQLIPYLYTAFAQYHFEGTPPIRSVVLEDGFPQSGDAVKLAETQFTIGDSMMAAPVFGSETERQVAFPAGAWFDFFTGQPVSNGAAIQKVQAELDKIPLYVRGGAIVPLAEYAPNAAAMGAQPSLEMRVYGKGEAAGRLYWDDGVTFDYEQGEYRWFRLAANEGAESGTAEGVSGSSAFALGAVSWRFMTR